MRGVRPFGYLYALRFTRQRGGRWRVEEAVSYSVRRVPKKHPPASVSWSPVGTWASRYGTGLQGRSLNLQGIVRLVRGAISATDYRVPGCFLGIHPDPDGNGPMFAWKLQTERDVAEFSAFMGGYLGRLRPCARGGCWAVFVAPSHGRTNRKLCDRCDWVRTKMPQEVRRVWDLVADRLRKRRTPREELLQAEAELWGCVSRSGRVSWSRFRAWQRKWDTRLPVGRPRVRK